MTLAAPPKTANAIAFYDDPTIDYPAEDDEPMAETPDHLFCMIYGMNVLTSVYADNPDVWVAGDNFVYYEPNNPGARVAPDIYVVFGVPKAKHRTSFFTWREGDRTPSIVFEFTSKKTKNEDIVRKRDLYEQVLRVPEYILFDPAGDYLTPPLQGFRLVSGAYVPIVPLAPGRIVSQILGLEIVAQGKEFRFFDPINHIYLDEYSVVNERAKQEAARAEAEAAKRAEAEAEVTRLRALLERLSAQNNREAKGEETA